MEINVFFVYDNLFFVLWENVSKAGGGGKLTTPVQQGEARGGQERCCTWVRRFREGWSFLCLREIWPYLCYNNLNCWRWANYKTSWQQQTGFCVQGKDNFSANSSACCFLIPLLSVWRICCGHQTPRRQSSWWGQPAALLQPQQRGWRSWAPWSFRGEASRRRRSPGWGSTMAACLGEPAGQRRSCPKEQYPVLFLPQHTARLAPGQGRPRSQWLRRCRNTPWPPLTLSPRAGPGPLMLLWGAAGRRESTSFAANPRLPPVCSWPILCEDVFPTNQVLPPGCPEGRWRAEGSWGGAPCWEARVGTACHGCLFPGWFAHPVSPSAETGVNGIWLCS